MENNIQNIHDDIPAEKFKLVDRNDLSHDKVFATKSISYFRGAFIRFCKNKGAIVAACVIATLILFAIIAPFCTPYTPSYYDAYFKETLPYNSMFKDTSFWDGCSTETMGTNDFILNYAMGMETGHNAVKYQKYEITEDGLYKFRQDSYQKNGCVYLNISIDDYKKLQNYQNETDIQVMYPTIPLEYRKSNMANQDQNNGNIYYQTRLQGSVFSGKTIPILSDPNDITSIIPNYWTYKEGAVPANTYEYNSKRIEGENGFLNEDGDRCFYAYSSVLMDKLEIRVNYYEYYKFYHQVLNNDGIKSPYFVFGTTAEGKDIFTCLSNGARFSFIFAIVVAVVNLLVGAIYGAIEGYYGGKTDIIMERISDILAAVPSMIIITLLKLYLPSSGHMLVLFISFFLTGWIGMAATTRMQFYRFKNQEYVLAARTLGAKDGRIMFKHIFPNAIGTLVTSCALVIPGMIFSEASLSYLGIINLSSGNLTSVGTLISAGQSSLTTAPHVAIFPTVFLVLMMLSFNLFGNGLRDAFNPSLRGAEG